MTKIFICDDQEIQLKKIKEIIENGILFLDFPMEISLATTDPEELIEQLGDQDLAVYFLDIDLSNEKYNGLKLALKIRERDPLGFLIFVTSHLEFGMMTFEYKLGAFDYILKTDDSETMRERILTTLKTIGKRINTQKSDQSQQICFVADHEKYFFDVEDLITIEIIGHHRIRITAEAKILECGGTLRGVQKDLPDHFFNCDRSTIINLKKLKSLSLDEATVEMSNGKIVQCSVRQYKKMSKLLDGKTFKQS